MESAVPSKVTKITPHCSSKEIGFTLLESNHSVLLFFVSLSSLAFQNCTSREYILREIEYTRI